MFDTSSPPTNVADAAVQGEVLKYLGPNTPDDRSSVHSEHLVLLVREFDVVRRSGPRLLRASRLLQQRRARRQVLDRAVSELRRLSALRLERCPEPGALRLP
jgi:hypothetical protein